MIDWMAEKSAQFIKRADPENTSSVEVMKFSLILILNTLSIVILTLLVGWMTNRLGDTAITLLSFGMLKFFSGGRHLKSSDSCVFWSTLIMSLLPHIPIYSEWVVWMTGMSLLSVAIYAPANVHKKARIPPKFYPLLKLISILIIALNFIFNSEILAKVFILQAVLLIPLIRR